MTAICASASATLTLITDINQLPGSALGFYSLIVGGGSHTTQLSSDTTINGNVALGSPISLEGGGAPINGELDFAGSSNGTGSVDVSGGITTNSAVAAAAASDAESLFQQYSLLTGLPTLDSNTLNVANTPGASYNGNTNEHVYAITDWKFNGDLAITAGADQYVIIDVLPGSKKNYSLGAVSLSGGITYDHVLFNIDTTGQLSSWNAHGGTVNAIILDGSFTSGGVSYGGKVNVDDFTLDGRLFCTTGSNDCQVASNATIDSTVDFGSSGVPEPISLLLTGSGLVLLAFALRRFRTRCHQVGTGTSICNV